MDTLPSNSPQENSNEGLVNFLDVKKSFTRAYNFEANSLTCGSRMNPETHTNLSHFHKELEDLMRKYKIVQTVASIFAKL